MRIIFRYFLSICLRLWKCVLLFLFLILCPSTEFQFHRTGLHISAMNVLQSNMNEKCHLNCSKRIMKIAVDNWFKWTQFQLMHSTRCLPVGKSETAEKEEKKYILSHGKGGQECTFRIQNRTMHSHWRRSVLFLNSEINENKRIWKSIVRYVWWQPQ